MKKQKLIYNLFAAALLAAPLASSAGVIIETYGDAATPSTVGGWSMTDIGDTGPSGTLTSSISSSAFAGTIDFTDYHGNALDMYRTDASNIAGWWTNYESSDYEVFTTGVNWVELVLPENTRALSFSVGSDFYGRGWMVGYSNNERSDYLKFGLSPDATPGFGVYADNSEGGCDSITSVVIDPRQWGVGNLSIAQSDQCTVDVPEPGIFGLLGLGIVGLGFARRKATR